MGWFDDNFDHMMGWDLDIGGDDEEWLTTEEWIAQQRGTPEDDFEALP